MSSKFQKYNFENHNKTTECYLKPISMPYEHHQLNFPEPPPEATKEYAAMRALHLK